MLPYPPPVGPSASYCRRFPLQCHDGVVREGGKALAHGLMLAYGELPHENVAFVGCHDNLTSFDSVGSPLPLSSPLSPPPSSPLGRFPRPFSSFLNDGQPHSPLHASLKTPPGTMTVGPISFCLQAEYHPSHMSHLPVP